MGGSSNADIQRTTQGSGAQAPIVPGTGRIMGGISNAEVQRTMPGPGVQAPIKPGTGQIMGGISNAEVQRSGGGPAAGLSRTLIVQGGTVPGGAPLPGHRGHGRRRGTAT